MLLQKNWKKLNTFTAFYGVYLEVVFFLVFIKDVHIVIVDIATIW